MKYIDIVLKQQKTIFDIQDGLLLFGVSSVETVKSIYKRMVKAGALVHIAHGFWALPRYDVYELANKMKTPSYISCERVLWDAGIIYQDYSQNITLVSDNTDDKYVNDIYFSYRKIKPSFFLLHEGIIQKKTYTIASPERAYVDLVYLTGQTYVDNFYKLDTKLLLTIAQLFNKATLSRITNIINAQSINS